jgi:hypothetical protein
MGTKDKTRKQQKYISSRKIQENDFKNEYGTSKHLDIVKLANAGMADRGGDGVDVEKTAKSKSYARRKEEKNQRS